MRCDLAKDCGSCQRPLRDVTEVPRPQFLYVCAHPATAPARIRAALISAGTHDWVGDPDSTHYPLVNVTGF